jgi:transposase-like protein
MRRTRDEWAEIVERYRKSDLSLSQFSVRNGISEQSLRNWVRKLDGGNAGHDNRTSEGFVEIAVKPNQANSLDGNGRRGTDGLVIKLSDGLRIEVRPETDRDLLALVLMLLRRAS